MNWYKGSALGFVNKGVRLALLHCSILKPLRAGLPRAFGALGRAVGAGPKHQKEEASACLTFLPASIRLSLVLRTLRKARAANALLHHQRGGISGFVGVGVWDVLLSLYIKEERPKSRTNSFVSLRRVARSKYEGTSRCRPPWLPRTWPNPGPRHSLAAFAGKHSRLAASNGIAPYTKNGRGLARLWSAAACRRFR